MNINLFQPNTHKFSQTHKYPSSICHRHGLLSSWETRKNRGEIRSYPSPKRTSGYRSRGAFLLDGYWNQLAAWQRKHPHESHFNEMCGGERRKGSEAGRVWNSEAEADGVSPAREKRRERAASGSLEQVLMGAVAMTSGRRVELISRMCYKV